MAKPAQTRASVSVGSTLTETRMLELAEKCAASVDDPNCRVRVESRTPHAVTLSLRDHFEGDELMKFVLETNRAVGRTTARTAITAFNVKDGGVSMLVPAAKRKIRGFSAYEAYMDWYVSAIVAEDRGAIVTLVSGKE
ncbi:hypothetical protein [Cellulomonas composti]|uniref:Uncharacterized protein n=1 Tax=Cellulomonas composti TaxID=266130 RepID=A0A511J7D3_9CELL|nr:hypothetical protein [Cellulomonas composti]GEL93623.1 hypothetical protein CCO02nite_02810 [Cellulomonas composti]